MNKKLIVLTILLFACYVTNAQQWRLQSKVYDKIGLVSRFIDQKDSVHFYYSSSRGSAFEYDDDNNVPTNYYGDNINCDYSVTYRTYKENALSPDKTNYYHKFQLASCIRDYDSEDRLINSKYYEGSTLENEEVYTYDTASRIKKLLSTTHETKYYYDTLGRLAGTETREKSTNVLSNTIYTYDTASRLILDTTYYRDSDRAFSNHYYYDTSGKMVKRIKNEYNSRGSTQTISNPFNYRYYPDGKLHIVQPTKGGTFLTYTYNSYGNIDVIYVGSSGGYLLYFYYEHYWPAGIAGAVKNEAELKVYPVPANTLLNVEAKFQEGGKLQGSVTDMQGSIVHQWNDDATTNYKKQVQLGHLPAGIYMLQLHTDGEVATRQFIKQ